MIRGITFNLQSMKSSDHAKEVNYYFRNNMGVFNNECAVTENVDGNLEVAIGDFLVFGRLVNVQSTEIVTVPSVASGTLYSILVFEIDLSQTNTSMAFNQGAFKIISDAADYPSLTQEDLFNSGNIYQLEFARFENTVAGIVALTDGRIILDMNQYVTALELLNYSKVSKTLSKTLSAASWVADGTYWKYAIPITEAEAGLISTATKIELIPLERSTFGTAALFKTYLDLIQNANIQGESITATSSGTGYVNIISMGTKPTVDVTITVVVRGD